MNDYTCHKKSTCPLLNQCAQKNLIYKCTIPTAELSYIYIGDTVNQFKVSYQNHITSFLPKINKYHTTSPADLIWEFKEPKMKYQIKWSKVKHTHLYS